jgi:peroxiredoxin
VSLGRVIAAKRNPTEGQLREAEKVLTEAREEGRKLKGFPEERVLAAEKALFELRSLTVGQTPPDLEGTALDGQRAKLSDYRGKVLVLTVWATHAVPALEMIPGQRALAQKYAGKPFAMLSISCDPEKARLTEFLKKEPMPWDHWWNGQKGGVLEAWTVNYFPTIYVFDSRGVIRYKNLNPKALDEAVETLLNQR